MTLCNTKQYLEASDSAYITARALVDEMALVARTLGLEIDDAYLDSLLSRDDLRNGGITSSMMMDAKAGRSMEVDVSCWFLHKKTETRTDPSPCRRR